MRRIRELMNSIYVNAFNSIRVESFYIHVSNMKIEYRHPEKSFVIT